MVIWRLISMLVLGDRFVGTLQYGCGDDSSPTIPWPEGLEGKYCGALALSQTDRSTQLAKFVHR